MADQPHSDSRRGGQPYQWFTAGDINGFFGLMVDNVGVLGFLAVVLVSVFEFPAELIFTKMVPGTALGVMFGDLVYTWMAFRLARRTGRSDVTAMPLGLDAPSTIGIGFTVLGPAFMELKSRGLSEGEAALQAWYVGMATMVLIGLIKLVFSFTGNLTTRLVPQAGLLGSLAGIGLALIGFIPMVEILSRPVVGMVALGLILYTMVARIRLPGRLPGVFAAVGAGTALYYGLGLAGLTPYHAPQLQPLQFGFPMPNLGFLQGMRQALDYLPIAFPFAILTVVGGINVTESARVAGDDYNTRDILLVEAFATLLAGFCGGVAQSTPYIGQPAFKAMGSRAGYTLLTGLFMGLGGMCGILPLILDLIPQSVLAPILIFVAIDIMVQAFQACPAAHAPAVALAYLPTVARLVQIQYDKALLFLPGGAHSQALAGLPQATHIPEIVLIVALGNGFILTAMLWGAFVAELIDRRLRVASIYLLVLSALSFFGVVHSAQPSGAMYLPWHLPDGLSRIPYEFSLAYLVLAALFAVLSLTPESRELADESPAH